MPTKPTAKQIELAKLLFLHELGNSTGPDACGDAATRLYEKLRSGLDPLLGLLGVEALLARALNLTQKQYSWLDELSIAESSLQLHKRFRSQEPPICTEAGALLFGTFLHLCATFIGERLTKQLVLRAWPELDVPSEEN